MECTISNGAEYEATVVEPDDANQIQGEASTVVYPGKDDPTGTFLQLTNHILAVKSVPCSRTTKMKDRYHTLIA
jgi:hypothetical protein